MDKAPENEVEQRFVEYWKRVLRRASSVAGDPVLRRAYQMFLDRQLTCPCTMSNGDFLQWNAIYGGDKLVEAEEDEDGWYLSHAQELAREFLEM